MRAKLNDKNLKNLADQTEKKIVDKGLGMATPFLLGKENPDPVIKLEFPAQKTLNADILIAKIAYLVFVHLTSAICEMQQLIMLLDTCAKQCFQSVSNRFMDCMTPTIDVQVGKEHQEQQQNYDSLWLCSS
jgi:dihydroneopterin aldolase